MRTNLTSEVDNMHTNESAENYLETILILSRKRPVVRSVDIAAELNFKKSSVSVAMKKLRENGNITVSPEGYITLTPSGNTSNRSRIPRNNCSISPPGKSARPTLPAKSTSPASNKLSASL